MLKHAARVRMRGYTLIEVLAVVVLMGLIAAVFVPSLASTSRLSQLQRLRADLIDLDTRARQLAVQGSSVTLRLQDEPRSLVLYQHLDQPRQLHSIVIPDEYELELLIEAIAVTFDANGQSPDYGYLIRSDMGVDRINFNGLSGWHEVRSDER